MKKLLLAFLLLTSLAHGQDKKKLFYLLNQSSGGSSTTSNIQSAAIVADNVYYTDEDLELDVTIADNITVTQYRWLIKDHGGLGLVRRIAHTKSPTMPAISVPGWYDIEVRIMTATDQYVVKKAAIPILPPKPTTPDLTIDLSAGNFYYDFTNTRTYSGNPIQYVKLTGSGTLYIAPLNLWGDGSDWADRVYFYKDGDSKITLTSTGSSNGLDFEGGKNILWNGYNDDKTRGFRVSMVGSGQNGIVAKNGKLFDSIGIFGTEFVSDGNTDISLMRFESPSTVTFNATTAEINNLEIYDNYFEGSGAESFYLGNSKDDPLIYTYIPTKINGAMMGRNESYDSKNEAFQIGCMLNFEMWDNYAETVGLRDTGGHRNAYQITAGSTGRVLNNFAINAKIPLFIETGLTPWDVFNGETSVSDGLLVDGNIFINGTEQGAQNEESKIYMIYSNATGGAYTIRLVNNTIFSKQEVAATDIQGVAGGNIYMVNNVCIGVPTGEDHNELKYLNTNPASSTVNNSFRSYTNYADLISYYNFSGDGSIATHYDPTSLTSAVFSGSPTDISGLGFSFNDYNGSPFPSDGDYTFGAFNGYGRKTITPDVLDATAPTFTTATVTNITESTAELHTELNEDGITYWSIIADGGTAPTVAQLIAGGFGLQSGSFVCPTGVEVTEPVSGLTGGTAYDVYRVAVNADNTAQAAVTKNDITTDADVVAPILSGWEIRNANPNRLYFISNEIITATTFGGFTVDRILGTTVTVTGVTINTGQLTDHYFTLSENVEAIDYLARIAYSGSGSNLQDASANALASIAATLIDNNITYSAKININITNSGQDVSSTEWNNTNTSNGAIQTLVANLDDDTNTPTGYGFAVTNAFHAMTNNVNATAGTYISEANALVRGLEVYNGGDNSGTIRLSGLSSGQAVEMIYIMRNNFGSGAGNVNVNGAGAVGYTTGTAEVKVLTTADGSGNVDWVITQTTSNTSQSVVAFKIITK
jgi:hypothetical protein